MAVEVVFCSNHCSSASVCGWYVLPETFTGNIGLERTSTGSGFKVVLAGAGLVGILPGRDQVVDERVVDRLRNFMAERGHVLEAAEDARRNPTGKGKDPARFCGRRVSKVR